MSKLHPNEPEPEYTEGERTHNLIGRRMEAFASRSREPGDATTWEVVLAALMCTLLIVSFSVAGRPLFALLSLVVFGIWAAYAGAAGKVNVFSVLWGSSTTDDNVNPDHIAILRSTAVVALLSIAAIVVDAFTGWGFGYYGYALLLVVILYLVVVIRTWIIPIAD